MRIKLNLEKSLEENASDYFEKAKKARQKAQRAEEARENTKKRLENLEKEIKRIKDREVKRKKPRKKEWFEKFRWFLTSDDMLVVGGRDATSNEIVVKKHTDKHDLVFHTELPGSPFMILKTEGNKPSEQSIKETAIFTADYSKAWKAGRTTADIFYVNPDQVTKEAPSGEHIGKGSFMIYGKKTILHPVLELFIGKMDDEKIMTGPKSAVEKHCKKFIEIIPGREKTSAVAKKVRKLLDADDLDELIRKIPPGSQLKK